MKTFLKEAVEIMKIFLMVFLVLTIINTVLAVVVLAIAPYPREMAKGDDAIGIIVNIFLLVWAGYLLTRKGGVWKE